jgi:cell division protein FtsI (penicillin-binding protein 3)
VAEQAFNWRGTVRRRLLVVSGVFAVWTIGVEVRLVFLQVIDHERLVSLARKQQEDTRTLPAKRGDIVDRHGRLLAYSVDADTIYAVPYEVNDAAKTAAAVCAALDECSTKERASLAERLTDDRPFTYVRRRVSPLEARKVAALNLSGIGFMQESRRFYPNRELAAHLLGYVGLDNVGLSGLEAAYDKLIRGKEGRLIAHTDARRQAYGARLERAPTSGGSLELTIDEQLQHIVERELRAGVEEKRADGGSAVVMDPHTGEILALANWPTFNPNAFNAANDVARRNRAVQDIYEPGSTFKVVTVAAALEERIFSADTLIETGPGVFRLGNRVIDEFEGHNYGTLSLTDVIVKSSNVGAVKIGLKIGAERFGVYAQRFGFGRPTSSDFPGESPGILWPASKLNDSGVASMAMGYQVGVTPLQMAAAMSAVANGGTWIEPRVVRAVTRDGVRTRVDPLRKRRVISTESALQMLPILERVVTNGTARTAFAKMTGYTVAGKTGTADKLVNGHYVGHMQNVSFLGFLPSRNPVLTITVMIDTPRVGSDTGGAVAAPIFRRIAEASMRLLGIPPNINPAPPILVARHHDPAPADPSGHSRPTSAPDALPSPHVGLPSIVALAPATTSTEQTPLVPDLRGMSARDAIRTLARLGLTARIQGKGVVVEQTPPPGSALERGLMCTLVLDRSLRRLNGAVGEQR